MPISAMLRPFSYFHRPSVGKGWWVAATKEEWLDALLKGESSPKPPPSWIQQQEVEGRSAKQAAIVWGRHYDAGRKYVIWSQASDEDFRAEGYLE